jgi:hypothetical protein
VPANANGNLMPVSKKAAPAPINVSFNSPLIRNPPVFFQPIPIPSVGADVPNGSTPDSPIGYQALRGRRADSSPCNAGLLTTPEEVETWLYAPIVEALRLQRPLPDDSLRTVARGQKKDGGDDKGLSLEIETNIVSSRVTDLS